MPQIIDRKLLELLVCPLTKTGLVYNAEAQELISERAKLAYPVLNGIPMMVTDNARQLNETEIAKIKAFPKK